MKSIQYFSRPRGLSTICARSRLAILDKMAQHKKPAVRDAILGSAFRLFAAQGYASTTLSDIAKDAGISPGNVYIYFASKLEILYAAYDPWLRARVERLEGELVAIVSPRKRLTRLLIAPWRDIPAEENGFLNNIMQAISVGHRTLRGLPVDVGAMVRGTGRGDGACGRCARTTAAVSKAEDCAPADHDYQP